MTKDRPTIGAAEAALDVLNALPTPALLVDPEGHIVVANRFVEQVFRQPLQALKGKCAYDFMPGPIAEIRRAMAAEAIAKKAPVVYDDPGGRMSLRTHVVPLLDDSSEVRNLAIVSLDVTDLAMAQQELTRFRAILDATTDFVGMATAGGDTMYINQAGRALVGLGADQDVSGTPITDWHPEWVQNVLRQTGIPSAVRDGAWKADTSLLHPDGEEVPVSQVVLAHRNADNEVEFLSTIARDTREQRAMDERLRQAQKMEAVGRLAGGVAHDFNNLLTVINGYAETLLTSMGERDPSRRAVSMILSAGQSAASLTSQLLAYSRRQHLQPQVIDLAEEVSRLRGMLERVIGEDIRLVTRARDTLSPVYADPWQIQQVLMNLILNARDAMPDGGIITVTMQNQDDSVRVSVGDTGTGMDAETVRQVFEPFFTTKAKDTGTGLGLATVYGIIQQSGGEIHVESKPGEGSTFHVLLPAHSGTTDDMAIAGSEPPVRDPNQQPRTILLTEDEDAVRQLVRQMLEAQGYDVLVARDGQQALSLADAHKGDIHLLLTDVIMPGLNGRQLAETLLERRPDLRVVYMTGYSGDEIMGRSDMQGQGQVLQKPFDTSSLRRMLAHAFD